MIILIFLVAHWYLSLFCQTFYLHRYAAHKMFSMSKGWEKFFNVLTWLFQGSSYLSPYAYGLMHRMHHAYADTEKDVHSPKYDSNLFTMMWRTKDVYNTTYRSKGASIEDRFKKDIPEWFAFETFAQSWPSRIFWILVYVAFYYYFIEYTWMWILLPLNFLMGPLHGAVINWFAHKYGYRNFEVADTSVNIMPVDIFMMGEGYHNNHHKFGGRPNFGGIKWHEIDPVYICIKIFSWVGIVKLKKEPTPLQAWPE